MLVLNTCPDKKSAERIAKSLVKGRLAACVSVIPLEKSFYWWKGKLDVTSEWLLLVKTRATLYAKVESHIKRSHPHKVPEIVGLKIAKGSKDYFFWLQQNTLTG